MQESSVATTVSEVVIQGTCDPRFERVREALATNFRLGEDIGASVAVFVNGEPVVDIWGGHLDVARTREWQPDSIVNMFSTTKTMTAVAALVLADRGELDFNAPVVKYWPEFAAAGKERIEVRHFLSHSSGLAGWTEPLVVEDLFNLEKLTTLLARQAPWWTPGTASGYHPISYGPLIGEVIRRITGRSLGQFFAEEVAQPLGADYHIGTGPECDARVVPMIRSSPYITPSGTNQVSDRAFFNPFCTAELASTIEWRRAELGGSNGHGNARSVGLVQSLVSNLGVAQGKRLLSQATCERALRVETDGTDLLFGFPIRWGLGYLVGSPVLEMEFGARIDGHRVACWGGSGGSWVMNDLDERMTIAYVMNKHVEHGGWDPRGIGMCRAAYDSLAAAR